MLKALEGAAAWGARHWHQAWRRWSLWLALVLLVLGTLVTQVWLTGRYEVSQVQQRLDRDVADAVADIREAFARNAVQLRALYRPDGDVMAWGVDAADMLRNHRELAHLEWRTPRQRIAPALPI